MTSLQVPTLHHKHLKSAPGLLWKRPVMSTVSGELTLVAGDAVIHVLL